MDAFVPTNLILYLMLIVCLILDSRYNKNIKTSK